jgi:hypothetical protein
MEITPEIKEIYELAKSAKTLERNGLLDAKMKKAIDDKKKEKKGKDNNGVDKNK